MYTFLATTTLYWIATDCYCHQSQSAAEFCAQKSFLQLLFDLSVWSTLHRVAFAFVDWQYHTWFPILWDENSQYLSVVSKKNYIKDTLQC